MNRVITRTSIEACRETNTSLSRRSRFFFRIFEKTKCVREVFLEANEATSERRCFTINKLRKLKAQHQFCDDQYFFEHEQRQRTIEFGPTQKPLFSRKMWPTHVTRKHKQNRWTLQSNLGLSTYSTKIFAYYNRNDTVFDYCI